MVLGWIVLLWNVSILRSKLVCPDTVSVRYRHPGGLRAKKHPNFYLGASAHAKEIPRMSQKPFRVSCRPSVIKQGQVSIGLKNVKNGNKRDSQIPLSPLEHLYGRLCTKVW